jgi:hypothetical protein
VAVVVAVWLVVLVVVGWKADREKVLINGKSQAGVNLLEVPTQT